MDRNKALDALKEMREQQQQYLDCDWFSDSQRRNFERFVSALDMAIDSLSLAPECIG